MRAVIPGSLETLVDYSVYERYKNERKKDPTDSATIAYITWLAGGLFKLRFPPSP